MTRSLKLRREERPVTLIIRHHLFRLAAALKLAARRPAGPRPAVPQAELLSSRILVVLPLSRISAGS